MSTVLLVILTLVEIVALVAVLALFVILITRRLRSLANTLEQVSGGVIRAIQGDVFLISPGASILNRKLNAIGGMLPALAEKAESLPSKQSQPAQQAPAQPSGVSWRPAVAQDPAIRRR
jgi:cobyric acid synthase